MTSPTAEAPARQELPAGSERRWIAAPLLLIAAASAIRLFLAWLLPLAYGESYYLASSRQLALSWFDQPPLSLWLIAATRWLFGEDSTLLLRLPQLLCFALTCWLLFRLTARHWTGRAGFLAVLLLNLSALFGMSGGLFVQPDALFFLLWLLAAEALWRAFQRPAGAGAWGPWLGAGLWLGLALLAKYPAVLLGLGALVFALTDPAARRWLWRPQPYAAALLSLACLAPVLLWNAQHDWISFGFQGGRAVQDAALDPLRMLGGIAGQAAWVLPWIWLLLMAALVRALAAGRRQRFAWYLVSLALPTLLLFTLVALWMPIGRHFHWQAPAYLMLMPLAGRLLDRWLAERPRLGRAARDGSVALSLLTLVVLAGHVSQGWLTPMLPERLRGEDDTKELVDWRPLGEILEAEGLLDRPDLFLVTNRWHQAGKLDAAVQGRLPVFCFCDDPRNLAFGRDSSAFLGRDAIVVANREFLWDAGAVYGDWFGPMEPWRSVTLGRGGREEVVLTLWRARDYGPAFPMPYGP